MTLPRAVATVWAAALVALCLLLLPGDWRGLAALPALGWWAAWSLLGQHHRALHALDRELDDQADELDRWPVEPWPPMEPSEAEPWPDEAADPVGYYAMRARRYAEPWQQRGPDEGPHVIAPGHWKAGDVILGWGDRPLDATEAADLNRRELDWREMVSDEAAPLGHQQAAELPELDHTRIVDVQSAELDTIWPDTLDQKAEALTERVRANFDLLRRMLL